MAKLILSGDLSVFRIEMVIRVLEAIKFGGGLALDGLEGAQIFMDQGKIVGSQTAHEQGIAALFAISCHRSGGFTVHAAEVEGLPRQAEFEPLADNAAVFRQVAALAGASRVAPPLPKPDATLVYPMPRGTAAPNAAPGASGRPPGPAGPPPMSAQIARSKGPSADPMARVPEVTDRARHSLRSAQNNAPVPGTGVDGDSWKFLLRVDGCRSLRVIAEELRLAGNAFNEVVEHLFKDGYIRFQVAEASVDAKPFQPNTKFRFGEYLISKGIISEAQLEGALRRQQEVARRGRYQWLGEILLEMNYIKPSHVQEALAVQKKSGG